MNDYHNIELRENNLRPQTCSKKYCHWKAVLLYVVSALVLLAIGLGVGMGIVFSMRSSDVCVIPKLTCEGSAPSLQGYYNIAKEFSFGFIYHYSVNFEKNMQIPFNDSSVTLGKMHTCVQTTGSKAVGPYNCSMNYMYDQSNCAFHF